MYLNNIYGEAQKSADGDMYVSKRFPAKTSGERWLRESWVTMATEVRARLGMR